MHSEARTTAPGESAAGQGAPTAVLVPGLEGTALLFYRQVPLLERRFDVVSFPLPDDSRATMDDLVAELRAHLVATTDEPVLLCGESFGGALCMSLALAHPELVRGLVVVNSFPALHTRGLSLAPLLLRAVPWGAMRLVRRFTESRLNSPHTLPEDRREFHERAKSIGRRGYIRRLEILTTYDIRERLGELRMPVLFLAGDHDRLVPAVREARFMAARVPNATLRVLEGFGHLCLINHDLDLLEHVGPWFDALPPPAG